MGSFAGEFDFLFLPVSLLFQFVANFLLINIVSQQLLVRRLQLVVAEFGSFW